MLAKTLPGTLKLPKTGRCNKVLETLQLTKTIIRQASLPAGNYKTRDGTRPRFDLTLLHIVEGIQVFGLMHRRVTLDDAHCVVLAHSFEPLAHGVAELTNNL